MTTSTNPHDRPTTRRDLIVAGVCGAFVGLMVGASYAAVPLYDWFCRVTGFNGTTQIATSAPGRVLDRTVMVRFDANVGPGLPWRFTPERTTMEMKLGEVVTVDYIVTNLAARETHGVAAYNVAPLNFGAYFQKINCFCFNEQTMAPGETRRMTVVFYVDPSFADEPDAQVRDTITLSYTFYPQRESQRPVADRAPSGKGS
ncbi:MAG: cytochrome c oxidase assembly protein [Pseudorhodoplanes sp.]|nr:cytochrome c oxidase assembly protein [Pseudorhodoplanes sp.]GIK79570.1 MAG: cytochrome c oxidase assembly protein CtaG [Alphaproteobacteria bacterium]